MFAERWGLGASCSWPVVGSEALLDLLLVQGAHLSRRSPPDL